MNAPTELLAEELIDVIDAFTDETPMTTGDVMGVLFSILVASAKESPNYDPKQLVSEMDAKIREAVGLQ